MKILVATSNLGKVKEFREMLGGGEIEFTDLTALPSPGAPQETGQTFRANACLKAAYYGKHYNMYALADDSGLSVDALDGAPGVHSARWAELQGTGSGDAANNATLLKQLADVPDDLRTARFTCVLALSDPRGRILLTAQDSVHGRILREPRGANGFGYDPLFFVESLGKTTAELEPAQKHRISHRGKALRHLKTLMERVGNAFEVA